MKKETNYDHGEVIDAVEEAQSQKKLPFINAHTHVFNFNHVHNHFLKGMIPWWLTAILTALFILVLWGLYVAVIWFYNFGFWGLSGNCLDCLRLLISAVVVGIIISFVLAPIYFVLYISYFQPELNLLLKMTYFRSVINKLRSIVRKRFDVLERYTNIVLHSYDIENNKVKSQKEIFTELQSYYPELTKFVVHSMDLDYMINCKVPGGKTFYDQLKELALLSAKSKEILPFIHTDPRRLGNKDQRYFDTVKKYIEDGLFPGIKIYPANGYFPFDIRLKPVYDLALKYNLPITTHCSIGPVYYRGKLKTLRNEGYYENGRFIHPFTGNELQGKNGKQFSPHFTHPLNYYCLMNEPELLYKYWKKCEKTLDYKPDNDYSIEDLKKYKNLKFCLAHFGGSEEWVKYMEDPWLPSQQSALTIDDKLLHLPNGKWVHTFDGADIKKLKANSWHSIISEMICKEEKNTDGKEESCFPYLYSDISYNLSNEYILPLLKVRLETNKALAKKILFGTDFFMVSTKASERHITMNVRSYIGEKNFERIAGRNPSVFLASAIKDISSIID